MLNEISPWTWEDFTWIENGKSNHTYPVYLNKETKEYFNGDRIAIITAKCIALIFGRPIHAACKTLYHLLILPKIFFTDRSQFTKHLVDIVRTPIYGIALTALAIVGVFLGIFGSEKIYDLRQLMGKIEQSLNWEEKHTRWTLAPCFQPRSLEHIDTEWGNREFSDTRYSETDQRGRSNFARFHVRRSCT